MTFTNAVANKMANAKLSKVDLGAAYRGGIKSTVILVVTIWLAMHLDGWQAWIVWAAAVKRAVGLSLAMAVLPRYAEVVAWRLALLPGDWPKLLNGTLTKR